MANYQNLEAFMKSRIYENDQHAITGDSTQAVLDLMIKVLGFGFQFGGIATPDGIPDETDARVFYLAVEPGTYDSYGGVELEAQRLGVITYSDEWAIYAIPMLSEVNTDDIVNAAVTANKLENGAVETDKIADEAVTHSKLASDAVESDNIKDGAVSASKLADNAVESSKIKDSAVSTDKLTDGAVTTSKVADKAVNLGKLGDDVKTVFDELGGFVVENVEENTIEAQSKHLYNVTANVDELAITLPTPKEGYTDEVKVHFVAGDEPELNITGGDIPVYRSGVAPKPHKEYMLTLRYNGLSWIATADCLTPADCLTFQSAEPFSITVLRRGWDGIFEYSSDGNTWHDVEVNTSMESANNGMRNVLYLRGHGNTTISNFTLVGLNDVFMTMEGANIHCVGDIRTLLNYKDVTTASLGDRAFRHLFDDCAALVSAPELPSLILTEDCYRKMFYGCTALTKAPELPAMTLAETCYDHMFGGCTALTKAPKLPATTLAYGCYSVMFNGCTALVSAPELPATELAESCYQGMFNGCTALTTAPELPATTLAEACYGGMFRNCTALVNAPELPVNTLAKECYREMFNGCTALVSAPDLPATTLAEGCYNSMFAYCTALVSAPELPATTLAKECYRSMFNGCTALVSAPDLPATTLAEGCYRGMFIDCSLTNSPELPATTLVKECYRTMFQRCAMLTAITMLATDITATDCLLNWANQVAASGILTKAASMQTLPSGPSGVPNGWTTVDA